MSLLHKFSAMYPELCILITASWNRAKENEAACPEETLLRPVTIYYADRLYYTLLYMSTMSDISLKQLNEDSKLILLNNDDINRPAAIHNYRNFTISATKILGSG